MKTLRNGLIVMALMFSSLSYGANIKICSDHNKWYPFTFKEGGEARGLHIDIITKALTDLGHTVEIKPLPWKQCIASIKDGKYDALATASYKDKRAKFIYYPDDAATSSQSEYRVQQVEYVVVTTIDSSAPDYDGNMENIPQPVLVPRGYSIAEDLANKGLKVDSGASGDQQNMNKLLNKKGEGALVSIPSGIKYLSESEQKFKGKFKVHTTPVKSKSYHLGISHSSSLTAEERQAIWEAVKAVRENSALMGEFTAKY